MWICASPRNLRYASSFWPVHSSSRIRLMRWPGGPAEAEEAEALVVAAAMAAGGEGALGGAEGMAAVEVGSTAVRMGSMWAALVIPVRRVAIPGTNHRVVQEAPSTASTNRPRIPAIPTTTTSHLRSTTVTTNHPRTPPAAMATLQAA